MKKLIFTTVFLLFININTFVYASMNFTDVSSTHWASEQINSFSNLKILNGYPDGSFKPNGYITRAELSKILCKAFNTKSTSQTQFTDVKEENWHYQYVQDAKDYISSEDNLFKPNQKATRLTVITAVVCASNTKSVPDLSSLNRFEDISEYSIAEKQLMASAIANGIVNGYADNTLRLDNPITRAEVCILLSRTIKVKNDLPQEYFIPTIISTGKEQNGPTIISASIDMQNNTIRFSWFAKENVDKY